LFYTIECFAVFFFELEPSFFFFKICLLAAVLGEGSAGSTGGALKVVRVLLHLMKYGAW
jgi:hypothetical protein